MKNEKAYIVVLAYIIGFTTAFIAYGISDMPGYSKAKVASDTPTTSVTDVAENNDQSASLVKAFETSEGLFATVAGEERIISAYVDSVDEPTDGFSVAVPLAQVSPDQRFIHYCEQSVEIPTECKHFVYVVAEHTSYRVKHNDVQVVSDIATVGDSWQSDGRLALAGTRSISADEPWSLE